MVSSALNGVSGKLHAPVTIPGEITHWISDKVGPRADLDEVVRDCFKNKRSVDFTGGFCQDGR
jgi:hypothetical protein